MKTALLGICISVVSITGFASKEAEFKFNALEETSGRIIEFANDEKRDDCNDPFSIVYQQLNVSTDRAYLEKLTYIYESSDQSQVDERKGSSLNISTPKYGSLEWGKNKAKIRSVASNHYSSTDFSLNEQEKIELSKTYTRSEDVQNVLDAWVKCVALKMSLPTMELGMQSESQLVVRLQMRPNPFRRASDSVKVKDISYSDNLELVKGDIQGRYVKYSGASTLVFKRKNLAKAFVIIDLAEGYVVPPIYMAAVASNVPAPQPAPTPCNPTIVDESISGALTSNISKNWLDVKLPNMAVQRTTFPNQGLYTIPVKLKAILSKRDCAISSISYTPSDGKIVNFSQNTTLLEDDGTLVPSFTIKTRSYSQKHLQGTITVHYKRIKRCE